MYGWAFRSGWWIVVLVLTVSLASAFFFTSRQPSVYRATSTLVVIPNAAVEGTADILRSLETLERRSVIATFARLPSAPAMREAAGGKLALSLADQADYRIAGLVLPNTNIIKIEVEGPDRATATRLAEAMSAVLQDEVQAMYRIYSLRPLATAEAGRDPVYPDPTRNYVVAGVLGLALGVVVALLVAGLRGAGGGD